MAKFIISAFSDEASPDILEQISACKANDVTHVELRGVNGKNISDFTIEEAMTLKSTLDSGGIKVATIGSHYGKIEITDPFEPHFDAFKNTVEVAKILDAKYIRIFSFYFTKGESHAEYKDEVIRRVGAMADYAQANGVLCCHENEKAIYGDIAQRSLEIHKALAGRLGGIFDAANYVQCGVDVPAAYAMLEEYIDYLHIKDARRSDGVVTPAGYGDGRLEDVLRLFSKKKGERVLCVEPHLAVFEGLDALETDDTLAEKLNKNEFKYPDRKASFKAAVEALKVLIDKIQPIKLGLIGIGNMGRSHIKNFNAGEFPETRISAVADINPERLDGARKLIPGIPCFNTAEELIDSGICNAVLIATPHYFHPPIAIYAFEKGLHVITEKPAGVYTKQVKEMNNAAAKSGKSFAIVYNQRTNHIYRKLHELVHSGNFGEIKRVTWIITDWYRTQAYYNSGGWRATWSGEGGGVLLNQCPHNLDLWQWICGMPTKIRAVCHEGKWHDIEVEDDVTIYAEYANGATGVFITTTGETPGTNRLEISLDRGKIVCENDKLTVYTLECSSKEHLANSVNGFSSPDCFASQPETDGKNPQHAGIVNAFAANILRGEPLYVDGKEGIKGLTISNAAHLSSWLGKDIEIPFDEDLFYSELQKKVASSKSKSVVSDIIAADMNSSFKQNK